MFFVDIVLDPSEVLCLRWILLVSSSEPSLADQISA